jgi:FdhD protein
MVESEAGITLAIEIASQDFVRLKEHRRSLAGRTGCGLCGAESLGQVMRELTPLPSVEPFPLGALLCRDAAPAGTAKPATGHRRYPRCLPRSPRRHDQLRPRGHRSPQRAGQDTRCARARVVVAVADSALVITSRASVEMVQKAATLGVGTLAAVSAPTARAVRLAESLNITLIGFLRQEACVVYTKSRILSEHCA